MIRGRFTAQTTAAELIEHLTARMNQISLQDRKILFSLLGGDLDPIVQELMRRELNSRGETFKQMTDRIYA